MLHHLVYVSSAVSPFSQPELVALLDQSRRNNAALAVSGMLLYKDGNMMQVLEGAREAVRPLYDKIAADPRHKGLLVLVEEPIETRQFADWSMAFRDLDGTEAREIPGYNEFLNTPLTAAEFSSDPTRCQRLLTSFKRNM